ncbi:MAG TPA: peptidoglycan-binding protein [Thermoanaerobaculia bacterium]
MPTNHVVQPGDCIASIAFQYGFSPEYLWEHDANAALREQRTSGYVLQPGDVVVVPELRPRFANAATGRKHVFRRLSVPEKLNVILRDEAAQPRKAVPFKVVIDGASAQEGQTGDDGKLTVWIPPAAVDAVLVVDGADTFPLRLGHLDPVETEGGLRARLTNLGYLDDAEASAEDARIAVVQFQQSLGLTPTGIVTDDLRRALVEAHGS